jgi:hypothetical protein
MSFPSPPPPTSSAFSGPPRPHDEVAATTDTDGARRADTVVDVPDLELSRAEVEQLWLAVDASHVDLLMEL